ncbi:hypothetical protein UFOVP1324_5 [uncultured Caudovirales phage]|uniref:Uncharacterized protein n=1 Tax=uncultured Caudovirales phage TaxID=2100421 RepID=A0A6J5RYW6_9CAUD|nr:hypothetical protein UFOVP1324_5 [uncultured Caudovirales phage]
MAQVRTLARSFAGGEVTPEFWGRIDDGKYQTGLAIARNFIPLPHGPAANRPGTTFVRASKDSTKRSVVRPFSYSSTQTMVLEFGDFYVRFHTQGATLLQGTPAAYNGATPYTPGDLVSSGGFNYVNILAVTGTAPPNATYWYLQPATGEYEIPSPYAAADVPDIHIEQSLDVLSVVHPGYPPRELRRGGATKWYFTSISFVSALVPPTAVSALATSPSAGATKAHVYVVTSLGAAADESLPSASTSVANNLAGISNLNTVSWVASVSPGVSRYNVYKLEGGIFGFIGQAAGVTFIDDNISADTSICPPENVNPFVGAGNYPAAVGYHEQRRCFAGTTLQPQNFWGTRSGTESNMQYAIPTREDDSLQFRIAARKNQTIRHVVSMEDLLLFTASSIFPVKSQNGVLTPLDFSVKPRGNTGANNVQPLVWDTTVLFTASRGGHVRETGFSNESGGWISGDLSLRAPHRFDNKDTIDAAASLSPYPLAWFVSSAGNLLSLTYVPEQNVGAWASHDTDGTFESICCVAEGNEDVLYAVVKRTIAGVTKRYIERLASRQFATQADCFFVDCGLSYSGAPATTFSGLGHLEGKTVSILGDGAVFPQKVVTGGQVTTDAPVSKCQIGLPITADIQLLPMAVEAQAFGQGRVKNVNTVWLRVYQSLGIFAGPALNDLREYAARTTEVFGSPPNLQTKECEITLTPTWQDSGTVYVRQKDPLPLTVVSMILEAEIAG